MKHEIKQDLVTICHQIMNEKKSLDQWREIESDDMFQLGDYIGGFDATEDEFCFSYRIDLNEYWFQFSLGDAENISKKLLTSIEMREAFT